MIILLGWCGFFKHSKQQPPPASFARGSQTCAEEGVLGPRPSVLPVQLPEASNLSVPDLARTERKGVRQLTGRTFFLPICEVKRMSVPLTFHRRKQLSIKTEQKATWLPLDTIKRHQTDC